MCAGRAWGQAADGECKGNKRGGARGEARCSLGESVSHLEYRTCAGEEFGQCGTIWSMRGGAREDGAWIPPRRTGHNGARFPAESSIERTSRRSLGIVQRRQAISERFPRVRRQGGVIPAGQLGLKSCALIVEGRSRSRRPDGESSGVGATEFLGREGGFLRSAEREEEDNLATWKLDGRGVEVARAELTLEVGVEGRRIGSRQIWKR